MVKTKVKELTDKSGPAGDLLNSAKSAVVHGLDGASKFVDDKTNHKYSSTIHTGVDKAKHLLGEDDAAEQDGKDSATPSGSSAAPGSAEAPGSGESAESAEPSKPSKPSKPPSPA